MPEQRSLDFFRNRTSSEIAGGLVSELWSAFILQVAYSQPAVRHAIIALGALHEQCQLHPEAPEREFAMLQYSKAIRAVSSLRLDDSKDALDVALLSCVLFAAFEILQGHYKSALTHFSSGISIVSAEEAGRGYVEGRHPAFNLLQPIFLCLDTQLMEVGDDLLPGTEKLNSASHAASLPPVETLSSIEEARTSIAKYRNHILHFFQRYASLLDPSITKENARALQAERVSLSQYYKSWCIAFDNAGFPPSHPEVLIMEMYRAVVDLIRTLVPSPDETKWDTSCAHFTRLVTLGEEFLVTAPSSACAPSESREGFIRPTFALSHGIVTPLFMTCTRCRDPSLRRRALRILQTCNRKEGIWDSARSARVAERVIQIEENRAGGVVESAADVPNWARIQNLETYFGPGSEQGRITYTMSAADTPVKIIEHLGNEIYESNLVEREEHMKCRSFFATKFMLTPRKLDADEENIMANYASSKNRQLRSGGQGKTVGKL